MNASFQRLWWLAVALFFASGLSSLIYQVLWMHILVLVFGGTTLATSTVVAVFMGGLALGSYLASRFADRTQNPFLWYGWLEGAIGIWALLAPLMFAKAIPLYQFAYQHHGGHAALNMVRFAVACLILLPPTTCMGATLPLLARMVASRLESLGDRIGLLYSVNTIGAVVGTVLAGFFLMPTIGLNATIVTAVCVNMGLALVVMFANKRWLSGTALAEAYAQTDSEPVPVAEVMPRRTAAIVALFAIAGGVSMIYEVAWTRALLLVIGSSTYAFTVMLAAFLLGIVLGSYVCSRFVDRLSDPVTCLAFLELLAGFAGFVGLTLFGFFPYWNLRLGADWFHFPAASLAIRFLLSGMILMPLTFCIGATFPAVCKACTHQLQQVGRSVGTVYSANTLGAIIGASMAGFYLVPALGSEKAIVVAALSNIAIGAVLLFLVPSVRLPIKILAGAGSLVLFLCMNAFPPFWDRLVLLLSQFERRELIIAGTFPYASYADFASALRKQFDLAFYRDGTTSNVAILQSRQSGDTFLLTNGHIDASSGVDMAVQESLSYFPLWCNPGAKDAAIVGWGSGVSVGAAGLFPLKRIDAVELEPAVIEAAHFFNRINHQPESDPRVRIIANDGRNYLLATNDKYDVIVSEPSNPWQSGVCNLFTREYFRICKQRLKPRGILSLWLQIVEVSPDSIKQIASALSAEFPHTLTFQPDRGNVVILASEEPIQIDWSNLKKSWRNGELTRDLQRAGMNSPEDVVGRIVMSDQGLRDMCAGSPANTDDRNRVEYEVAKSYESRLYLNDNDKLVHAHIGDAQTAVVWPRVSSSALSTLKAGIAATAVAQGNDVAAGSWVAAAFHDASTAEAYRVRGLLESMRGQFEPAAHDWQEALRLEPDNAAVYRTRAQQSVGRGKMDSALKDYERALQIDPQDKLTRYSLARLYAPVYLGLAKVDSAASPERVLSVLAGLTDDRRFVAEVPNTLFLAADARYRLDKLTQAEQLCGRYLAIVPNSYAALHLMALIEDKQRHSFVAQNLNAAANQAAHRSDGIPRQVAQAQQMIARGNKNEARHLLQALQEYTSGDPQVTSLLNQLGNP